MVCVLRVSPHQSTYTHGNHRDPTFSCSYSYVWETRGFKRFSDAPLQIWASGIRSDLVGELELGKESGDH